MARLVLVHGAMGNRHVWGSSFLEDLKERGHTVEAFDLPGQGDDPSPKESVTLQLYADRVVAQLRSSEEPAVLIGHSMGGMVVTQAADDFVANGGNLNQVIYMTAFLPRNGESLLDLAGSPEGQGDAVQANLVVSGEPPMGNFPIEAVPEALYNMTSPAMMKTVDPRGLESQPIIPFTNPVNITDDREITRRYIFALNDRAIPLPLQQKMAASTSVVETAELHSDHMPYFSTLDELLDIIDRFTRN